VADFSDPRGPVIGRREAGVRGRSRRGCRRCSETPDRWHVLGAGRGALSSAQEAAVQLVMEQAEVLAGEVAA
jgi:hypothetical protein